jgi:hypothetical protein
MVQRLNAGEAGISSPCSSAYGLALGVLGLACLWHNKRPDNGSILRPLRSLTQEPIVAVWYVVVYVVVWLPPYPNA